MSGDIRGWLHRDGETSFIVGASEVNPDPDDRRPYHGPAADVYVEGSWFHICTDRYEGNAFLRLESLPYLIEALTEIYKKAGIPRSPTKAAVRAVKAATSEPE